MQKTITTIIQEIKEDIRTFIESKKSLFTLTAYEKAVPAVTNLVYTIILAFIGIFVLSFLLMTGAFAFGLIFAQEAHQTVFAITMGFACLSGVLLLLLLLLLIFKKAITRNVQNKVFTKILDDIDQKEAEAEASEIEEVEPEEINDNNDPSKINPIKYE